MANTTTYSEDQIAHALAVLRSNRGNAKRTAAQLNIPRTTLRQWAGLSPVKGKQVTGAQVEAAANKLADDLDIAAATGAQRLKEAIGVVPIETATDLRQFSVSLGITIEKASFARGGPTSRTQNLQVTLIGAASLQELGGSVLKALNQPTLEGQYVEGPDKT